MAKLKKGQKLVCVPCGTELIVGCCGASESTIWCCGKRMTVKGKKKAAKKK
ncbi:MAG: hypothetical protein WC658_03855 [Candidatus Omnitrophota bacterium]